MKKFCTNCGKPLDENGKVNEGLNNNLYNEIIVLVKNMLKKPIDTLTNIVNMDSKYGLIFLFMAVIAMDLMFLASIKVSVDTVSNVFIYNVSNVNYLQYFFIFALLELAFIFIYISMLYLVNNKLFKNSCDYKTCISLVGYSYIYITIGSLITTISLFIYMPIAFLIFLVSSLLSAYALYAGIKTISHDENNNIYIAVISIILTIVAMYIISMIFQ